MLHWLWIDRWHSLRFSWAHSSLYSDWLEKGGRMGGAAEMLVTWMGFLTFTSHGALANPFQSLCFSLNHYLLCSSFFLPVILSHFHNTNASDVQSITVGLTCVQASLMLSLKRKISMKFVKEEEEQDEKTSNNAILEHCVWTANSSGKIQLGLCDIRHYPVESVGLEGWSFSKTEDAKIKQTSKQTKTICPQPACTLSQEV